MEVNVRVRGSEGAGFRDRILELNSTGSQFSNPIITFSFLFINSLPENVYQ